MKIMEREKQISLASNNITDTYDKNGTLQITFYKRLTLWKAYWTNRNGIFGCLLCFTVCYV